MLDEQRERDWLWLCSVPGLYWKEKMVLLRYFGGPGQIRRAGKDALRPWEERGIGWVKKLYPCMEPGFLDGVTQHMARAGVRFVSREAPAFPGLLRQISDCPYGIFYKGALPAPGDAFAGVGVVGARACSAYGKVMAERIAGEVAGLGAAVVSGLAMGIDGIAQAAALRRGGTSFAVLGCGVDICYPTINRELYERLEERGGILSEFPCGVRPQKMHFPMRNRLISGLSRAVAVIEAGERSGSLITARLALDQGREVYAVPGRVGDPLSAGCNALIADGAGVIVSPAAFASELCALPGLRGKAPAPAAKAGKGGPESGLAREDELVYSSLDLSPRGREELARRTGLPLGRVQTSLLRLELADLAVEVAKDQFIRS